MPSPLCTPRVERQRSRGHGRGLTLIELMIAVAVVAILAAVALPNYLNHVQRAQRNNAKATLLKVAQFMERAATANGLYPLTADIPASVLVVDGGARYTVAIASANGTTYTATATRTAGTKQATDACGDFRIDQAGNRSILNAASGQTVASCWDR